MKNICSCENCKNDDTIGQYYKYCKGCLDELSKNTSLTTISVNGVVYIKSVPWLQYNNFVPKYEQIEFIKEEEFLV